MVRYAKPKPFATEADLCAAFIAWVGRHHPEVKCYAEWAGWDILLAYPEGWQIGVQAKLRLNAEVVGQAAPDRWATLEAGPDFRAVLVPDLNPLSGIAERLGLVVFYGYKRYGDDFEFYPSLKQRWGRYGANVLDEEWIDWNPATRHALPPTQTDAIAGSPCPVSLTTWKLGALDVLAVLATEGTITTKRMRALGVNPSRWLSCLWLVPAEKRGEWLRGDKCPKFDEQHPSAFALALTNARERIAV